MAKGTLNRDGGELSTIIGEDAKLEGDLVIKHSGRIDGRIKGMVTSSETVTIGAGGSVEGNISAKDVVLGGKVTGDINASNRAVLEKTAVLTGNLKTVRLIVEEGAVFNGISDMGESPASDKVTHRPQKIKLSEE